MARKTRQMWTKQRVLAALKRAALEIWDNDITKLPSSTDAYNKAIQLVEPISQGHNRVLYACGGNVLRYFDSMNHAWYAIGFLVKTKYARVAAKIRTPEVEEQLREIYRYANMKESLRPPGLVSLKDYAKRLGCGHHILSGIADDLGLRQVKEPNWTRAEIRLLEKYGHLSPTIIQKRFTAAGFHRSKVAITLTRKRRNAHKGSPYYSNNALMTLLGYDPHKMDREWLVKFKADLPYELKGTPRGKGAYKQTGDTKLFHVDTIREFIMKHPEEIELHKVDKMWFLWLVTNGRISYIESALRMTNRSEGYQPGQAREHRLWGQDGKAAATRRAREANA